MSCNSLKASLAVLLCLWGFAVQAHAAGFYIQEQSVSGLGTAFAGAVTGMPDASTIYHNPAGMIELDGSQISVGAHIIAPDADLDNSGSTAGGTIIGGINGDNPFDPIAIPNFYLAFPLTHDQNLWAGLGISSPFGLQNEYDENFFGRYNSTESNLKTVNVAPSFAWAVTDWLSVGGGIDVQHADAKLENAIPSPLTPGVIGTDGFTDLSGNDLTTGFNAGLLLKPVSGTKIGAHYRQGISHTLEGRVITVLPANIGGAVSNIPGTAELDLPNIASSGISQELTNDLKIMGQVTWFEWSNFDDIPITTPAGFSAIPQNYENTFAVAIGAEYKLSHDWQLKAGFQFDETPSVDGFRSTRIPDGDRMWFAGGARYDINDQWAIDFAGAYIDVGKETINLTETSVTGVTVNTAGTTESHIGILSAALRYKFDTGF